MIIITIRTDKPEAEVGLFDDQKQLGHEVWQAHRELGRTIHLKLRELLEQSGKEWSDVRGVVGYLGPGSFTGLRIGLTVANALASANQCPVVGEMGEDWKEKGIRRLLNGENDTQAMPEYGAEAHITQQKK